MNLRFLQILGLALGLAVLSDFTARAEQHRATRLGNPATRFAPTLFTPGDLRSRFADEKLRPDFVEVLRQWGWPGNPADLFAAAATNEITEIQIPVGDTMPFMSSREAGRPICLRNVTWAGMEPISAYAFTFRSNGRVYRCITPKPCSNFFVVDQGPEPRAGLALSCDVPEKVLAGQKLKICLTVHNTGNITEPAATAVLRVPQNTFVTGATDLGAAINNTVQWKIPNLPPGAAKEVCVQLKTSQPGMLAIDSFSSSAAVPVVSSSCQTLVVGIPAVLLEKSDDPDPVSVGSNTTYTVKVTNQGTADDANVQMLVTIAPQLVPVSASEGTIEDQMVRMPLVTRLPSKQAVTYKIIARGVRAGDGHTSFKLSSDALKSPITAEESTTVY